MSRLMTITTLLLIFLQATLHAGSNPGEIASFDAETAQNIEVVLGRHNSPPPPLGGGSRLLSQEILLDFYQQRKFQPLWFDGLRLKTQAQVLLESLRDAGAHGLCGNDYLLEPLEVMIGMQMALARQNLPLVSDYRALLELFLSQAFLTYATHMVEGQVDPALAHVDWSARRRKANLVKLLEYAVVSGRMSQVLDGLRPPHEGYRQLAVVLQKYQQISAAGGWPVIPPGRTIRPGEHDPRIPRLRTLLRKTGDLQESTEENDLYDSGTIAAVHIFQRRHGLVDDGVIGPNTLEKLNVSVDERIRQIELNLERWRWMPKNFGERYLRVNVADFSLEVIVDGEPVMQMPVIVGTQYRKTPVFSARMSYVEFAPYWIVPVTILREDKLPAIKKNPAYLEEKHFRIIAGNDENSFVDPRQIDWASVGVDNFPGLLRMDPGPWNPLGRVKFMFPNRYDVYLHDTNETYLFDNNVRPFSSGCIRVKRPFDLAYYLLGEDLGAEMLQELFEATSPVQVSVEPLPVHIQYWTAWVDHDGLVHFRSDVYFRDLDLDIALTEPAYRVMEQLKVGDEAN